MEIPRVDDPMFERFAQVYIVRFKQGVAKGWYYYRQQRTILPSLVGKHLLC